MRNDITSVRFCLTTFPQKNNCILLELFKQTTLDHLNTELVPYSDPHCIQMFPLFRSPKPQKGEQFRHAKVLLIVKLCYINGGNGMLCHRLNTLRESRILWHFIEPSFVFCASLSHSLPPSLLSLFLLILFGQFIE